MKKIFIFFILFLFLCSIPFFLNACQEECTHAYLTHELVAPTCDAEGYTLNSCANCAFQFKTDFVPPTGHTLSTTVFSPTCTEDGYTYYHCTCGYMFNSNYTAPLGHSWKDKEVISPSCDSVGHTVKQCSACGVLYEDRFTEPLGHSFTKTIVSPSCTAEGYTLNQCGTCELSYKNDFTVPTGHTFTSETVYPTRLTGGALTQSCSCGYSYSNPIYYSDVFYGAYVSNQTALAKGVDVSVYQHVKNADGTYRPLDWRTIKGAGFDFAILKIGSTPRTDGGAQKGGIDATFEMDYQDAKAIGMELGVYFFTYATTPEQAKADAMLVISWLKDKQLEYPVYFDLEDDPYSDICMSDLGRETLTEICYAFITTLQENGYYGALYSNHDWLTEKIDGNALKNVFDVWYARLPRLSTAPVDPSDNNFTWNTSSYGKQLGMWQYTHYGAIEGIEGITFDFNYVYRDYPAIIKQFGYNGYTPYA